MAYISKFSDWYGQKVIDNLGVNSCYDILIMTFWLSTSGPADAVLFYDNIYNYVGSDIYGKNTQEVQKTLSEMFKSKGK